MTVPAPERSRVRDTAVRVLLLILLPGALFLNSLSGDYHLDDIYRIRDNPEIERVSPIFRHFTDPATSATLPHLAQYRPLLPLTLSISAWIGDRVGTDRLAAHHVGNLVVHLATVLALFALFSELLRRAPPSVAATRGRVAFLAAMLFAVHPVAGVPVNYLCARDLLLMNLFLVGALFVYARMRRVRGDSVLGWASVSVLLFLSLCSKTNAAVAFAIVLAFEASVGGASLRRLGPWIRTAGVAAVVGVFFAWTAWIDFSDYDQLKINTRSPLEYPVTQLDVHTFYYLRNVLWPLELRPLPSIEAIQGFELMSALRVITGAFVVAGSLLLSLWLRKRRPVVAFAIVAYWVLFALTSSIIPLRSLATDYRQVPSLAFLFLALAAGPLAALPTRAANVVTLVLALWFGGVSWHMNEVWRTDTSLWGHAVAKGATGRAHMNYGRAVQDKDPGLAEEH